MEEKSRTEHSARNALIAMISRIAAIAMGYAARVVFTRMLGESYVGINGLFTDIVNVLSLSELGIGTAIAFALYKPVAEGDIGRQKAVMRLFRNLYRGVAAAITAVGLLVVPFLGYFVRTAEGVDHILAIYLLYLAGCSASYLCAYKRLLIDAYQLNYIRVLYQMAFLAVQYVFQIAALIATRNFILYLLIYLLCVIANNICITRKADSMYPFLRDGDVDPLPPEEKRAIFKDIKAMMMHKFGSVAVGNTDNLLIAAMIGIADVGRYSNYYLIIGSVRQVLGQAFYGILASVGNLGAMEDKESVKTVFETSFFIGQWAYGWAAICLFQLLNPFVAASFGSGYVFPEAVVFVLCLDFLIAGFRWPVLIFRDALGIFRYDRYVPFIEAVANLAASILLARRFGIIGVFLGTAVSALLVRFWVEPYVLYRKRLESPVAPYFLRCAVYSCVIFVAGMATRAICSLVPADGLAGFAADMAICAVVPNLLFLLSYHRTQGFRSVLVMLAGLARGRCAGRQDAGPGADIDEGG